ncbi:MAG: Gfo/Idh/MocA family oxidoreductase [Provencibacterium sp.]|jgi:predicted dehydrogenase|nr:Gfo/Idh/MocA family oxidoreductase [Provencibacterium sp.]
MKLGKTGRSVRLGIIGLGGRGLSQMDLLLTMPDVEIVAVCDRYEDRIRQAQEHVQRERGSCPAGTADYREVNAREDIEAVVIMTSWTTHILIAVDAMKQGKIPAMEVGGASSIEECWQLVRTSEKTGIPVMLLENCCYGKEEMTLLNMIRQGVFGEIIHCRGGYMHDLREEIGNGDLDRHYRQENFIHRNGELYPTHELGPIAKYINLNHGNRMLSLVSMASKAVGAGAWMKEHRPDSPLCKTAFNEGDVVTTMIKCANGETIVLTHDCTLPRPYSRGGYVQGLKGVWEEDNRGIYLEGRTKQEGEGEHRFESDAPYMEEYMHPLWREYEAFGLRGGHGGMDYLVLRAFIESIQNGRAFPIDVYDTASWMAVTCLSEQSVAMGSMPVPVPDFTDGRWIGREQRPGDIFSLDKVYSEAFR